MNSFKYIIKKAYKILLYIYFLKIKATNRTGWLKKKSPGFISTWQKRFIYYLQTSKIYVQKLSMLNF